MTHPHILLAGLAVLLLAAGPAPADWHIETVDADHPYAGSVSVGLSGTGRPAVAYGHFIRNNESSLRFAVRSATGAWDIATVDTQGDTGHGADLAFDAAGRPHIAYYSYWTGPVKYATDKGSGWNSQPVSTRGTGPSLALDAAGRPRVAYCDDSGHLMYAAWTGTAWSSQAVDASAKFSEVSLALDDLGRPRIAYYDTLATSLKYAEWTGASWHTTVVDNDGTAGQHNALAIDAAGRPHISYYDYSRWHLKYAVRRGSSWTIDRVTEGFGVLGPGAKYTDIALDDLGRPRIVYNDTWDTDGLMYASWDGSRWSFEPADPNVDGLFTTSLVLDDQGRPYIAYMRRQPSSVVMIAWIPEPATLTLLAAGAAAVAVRRSRR
jgi:hypothetical protein